MANITASKSGNPVMFKSIDEAPIRSLKAHFAPVQAGSGDPSPSNIRPITGWTGLDVTQNGINQWDEEWEVGTIDFNTGEIANANNRIRTKNFNPCFPNTTYYGIDPTSNNNIEIFFYDKNKVYIRNSGWTGNATFTSPNNACYFKFIMGAAYGTTYNNDISINYPSTDVNYHSYVGSTYPISWQSEAGTVYGGYMDLMSGDVVAEWVSMDMSTLQWTVKSNNNVYWFYASKQMPENLWYPDVDAASNNSYAAHIMFDKYKTVASAHIYNGSSGDNCIGLDWTYPNASIRIRDDSYNQDIDNFTSSMNNKTLYYELATPITITTLTPTQLSTLRGQNTIVSTANGTIDAEYDLHEAGDIAAIRRRVNQSAPHIVTSTPADIVTFNTDLAAPIKELRCEFMPVQESSGDPSPENVRPISGWTGAKVTRTGVNVWDEEWEVGDINTSGVPTTGNFVRSKNFIAVKPETTYSWFIPDNNQGRVFYYDASQTFISYGFTSNAKFTTPANAYYVKFRAGTAYGTTYNHDISINYPSTDTEYHAYFGTTIPITFPSEAGTVYGGYVDLVKGEVVQTWDCVDLGDLIWIAKDTTGDYNYFWTNSIASFVDTSNNKTVYWYTSHFASVARLSRTEIGNTSQNNVLTITQNGARGTIAIRNDEYNSPSDFKTWVSGKQLAFPLATPIHTPITPAVLNILKGTNNIWSNANGPTTVSYWTH